MFVEREENRQEKLITGTSGFFLVQKWPFRGLAETPMFMVFFGVRAFFVKLSKKGNFGHPPRKGKND